MSLARAHTWNAGDILKAADLNGEFNNVLNNPVSLISPSTGAINFNLQAHTNLLPSAITATSGVSGQVLGVSSSGSPSAFISPYAGSRIRNMQMVASSQNAQFTADEYLLKSTNTTQTFTIASTAVFTVNLATAGPAANGRDQAGSFASTFLHYYGITTGAGSTTPAGIVSSQPPSVGPTLPTGYVGWVYLTSLIYSSATTQTNNVRQRGAWLWNDSIQNALTGGQSTTATSVSLASVAPPQAQNVKFNVAIASNAGGAQGTVSLLTTGSNTVSWTAVSGFPYNTYVEYPNLTFQYQWSTQPSPGAGLTLSAIAYSVPNGDAA